MPAKTLLSLLLSLAVFFSEGTGRSAAPEAGFAPDRVSGAQNRPDPGEAG